jgi:hypothetical protein
MPVAPDADTDTVSFKGRRPIESAEDPRNAPRTLGASAGSSADSHLLATIRAPTMTLIGMRIVMPAIADTVRRRNAIPTNRQRGVAER